MNGSVLAGLTAAIPLAAILIVYVLARGNALVAFFQSQDESLAKMPEKALFALFLGAFIGVAFLFGALAGLVYGWLGMPVFRYVAAGATVLFSVLAVVSKQPLPGDKIVWNLAVGGVMGIAVPLLAS